MPHIRELNRELGKPSCLKEIIIIIIINTLFEIGKKLDSSAKDLQSNLYQL